MDNNDTKNIINSYNKKNRKWSLITFLSFCLLLLIPINLFLKLILSFCFLVISYTAVINRLKNKYIYCILIQELNPQKFYTVLCGTNSTTKFATDEITVAFLMRDYNAVINICNSKLKEKNLRLYKYYYLQFLARVYFELGDFENLRLYCEKFDLELANEGKQKTRQKIEKSFGNPIQFYKNYLEGNFKDCKELYKSLFNDKSFNKNKLVRMLTYYSYAIACFKLNEYDEAKLYFIDIINNAPLLGLSQTAKKYIFAIENSTDYIPENQNIEIEESYNIPEVQCVKPDKKTVAIGIISMIALVVILCVFSYSYKPKTLDKVLTSKHGMTDLISTVEMNEQKDLLCFYSTKRYGYCASFLNVAGKNKYKIKLTADDIQSGYIIEFAIAKKDLLIKFAIYEEALDIPAERVLTESFTENGKTKYFCLLSAEKKDCRISYSSSYLDENLNYHSFPSFE